MAKLTGLLWHLFLGIDEQSPALPEATTKTISSKALMDLD